MLVNRRDGDRRHVGRRRIHKRIDLPQRNQRASLVDAILQLPLLRRERQFKRKRHHHRQHGSVHVLKVEGVVASVYSAWEPSRPRGDNARYREIDGVMHRKLGSGRRASSNGTRPDPHEAECRRAYEAIYREYPDVKPVAIERDGEVVETWT